MRSNSTTLNNHKDKLQRPNSGSIQHTPHEAPYTSQPDALTFASHLKKFRNLSFHPSLRGNNDLRVGRKMQLSIVFSVQGKGGSPKEPGPKIGWVIKTLEAQVGQFLLGCKCLVSRGIVMQEQDPFGDFPTAFFLQNVLRLHQPAEMSNTTR